jgi:glutathione S-transferase
MLTFYALSGSPFSWKVWLVLEHKKISYELHMLSADAGDLQTPAFSAINPRGKVPAIVDEGFALHESSAIAEYLDDAYPGPRVTPRDAKRAALARRIAAEAEAYLYPHVRTLVVELLTRGEAERDEAATEAATLALRRELGRLETAFAGAFFLGDEPSIADFAAYPLMALLMRVAQKQPHYEIAALVPESVAHWMKRIEALPYFDRTTPPHWKIA